MAVKPSGLGALFGFMSVKDCLISSKETGVERFRLEDSWNLMGIMSKIPKLLEFPTGSSSV